MCRFTSENGKFSTSLTLEDGTERLSRNFRTEVPFYAA